nr:hypothetical protein Ade03nite_12990 [Actinoplanes derwentensis]
MNAEPVRWNLFEAWEQGGRKIRCADDCQVGRPPRERSWAARYSGGRIFAISLRTAPPEIHTYARSR